MRIFCTYIYILGNQIKKNISKQLGKISGSILIVDCYGPSFQAPFPPSFTFSNSSGGVLDCQVGGEPPPKTTWITQEGTPVSSYPGILSLLSNGSLHYHEFSAERWRSDIHDSNIRCQSSNVYGTVISTIVHIKGGKHSIKYHIF